MVEERLCFARLIVDRLASAASVKTPYVHRGEVTGIGPFGDGTAIGVSDDKLLERSDLALVGVLGHEFGHLLAGHLDRPLTTRWRRIEYLFRRTRFEIAANTYAVELVGSAALAQSYVEEINAQLGDLGHKPVTKQEALAGGSRYIAAELDQIAKVLAAVPSNTDGVLGAIVAVCENEGPAVKYPRGSRTFQ